MNSFCKLRDPGRSVRQAHPGQSGRPSGQTGGILILGALWGIKNLASAARKSFCWLSRWYRRRTEFHKLQALTDYHLKDIGLDRFPIASSLQDIVEREIRSGLQRHRLRRRP